MRFLFPLIVVGLLIGIGTGFAQVSPETDAMSAVITGPADISVGKTLVLDASASQVVGERTEYRWTIDETRQSLGRNVEAIYTPEKAGKLTFRLSVRSVGLDGVALQDEVTHEVIAFKRKIVVIADAFVPPEKLAMHADEAMKSGVYVKIIQAGPDVSSLMAEESIRRILSEDKNALSGADDIVIWTDGISGLQALLRAVQENSEQLAVLHQQNLVIVTDRSLGMVGRTAQGALELLQPAQVLVTRAEAMNPLLQSSSYEEFMKTIQSRDIDSLALEPGGQKLRPWNFLSVLVNYLLSRGVSSQAVILLLMLPVIATIFTFLKQVVGITTFGLYTPSIVALSFLALGSVVGALFLILILLIGHLTRSFMRRWRLLYIPKVAIILTVVSLSLLLLVSIGTAAGLVFSRDTIFILLIMSTLSENFLQLKTEEGWWSAVSSVGETIFGALLCVVVVQMEYLQALILAFPELLLITLVLNVLLGRWTGLRLLEYFRFREVFKHLHEEE